MKNYVTDQFQMSCEKTLDETLRKAGFSIINTAIKGEEEKYIYGQIFATDLEFYIYIDGAEVVGPGIDLRFQWPDYSSEHEMIENFVKKVELVAKQLAQLTTQLHRTLTACLLCSLADSRR